uniref:Uncharacterized protein n=1 Tax=Rhizophora mucronata TaxID=61149 RepID=A0A2P2PA66_RHIMU
MVLLNISYKLKHYVHQLTSKINIIAHGDETLLQPENKLYCPTFSWLLVHRIMRIKEQYLLKGFQNLRI